jgi:hypothetical protein
MIKLKKSVYDSKSLSSFDWSQGERDSKCSSNGWGVFEFAHASTRPLLLSVAGQNESIPHAKTGFF